MQTPHVGLDESILGRAVARAVPRTRRQDKGSVERRSRSTEAPRSGGPAEVTPPVEAERDRTITAPLPILEPADEFDRFRSSRLSQVEVEKSGFAARFQRSPQTTEPVPAAPAEASPKKVWHLFDRVLLGLEITGALIVAWLAFQYVYTVYFDTAPKRVSHNVMATPSTRSGGGVVQPPALVPPAPSTTPTRFVEVLPSFTGGPEDVAPGKAVPPAGATATILLPTPAPTIDPQLLLPSRLRIPVMFLDSPVHEVTVNMGQWEVSSMDIGHHEGTGNPGDVGNVVLAGHRDINSALFRELDRLEPGDEIFVSNSLGEYRYIVQESFVVTPSHTEVMDPTPDRRLTLITCTPIGLDTQRLIVTALLDERAAPGEVNSPSTDGH
jgi:LPXTG-site transpeptidase (sortase) family protein